MNPTQEQPQETNNEIQLPDETPMNLEVVENQPTSNPVSSIAPEVQKPIESIQPENTPDYKISSSEVTPKSNSQKTVLIIAGVMGVVIVLGAAFFILRSRNNNVAETPAALPTEEVTQVPTETTESTTPAPEAAPAPINVSDYLLVIKDVESKTLDVIKNTPINVNSTTQSTDQIRFASDNLFANFQTLSQATVPDVAKEDHAKLLDGYKKLVDSYDVVLKSLKENNKITTQARDQFTTNYNASVVIINQSLTNIKNLK